ncbi:MAG TPA: thioesterase family protein [Anaerolineae bacterium]|nr:thioesterase family protein [Anaerolineae bacterium]
MKLLSSIKIGLITEATEEVTPELTAPHIGSGSLSVYATPAMAALVEHTCASMISKLLPEGHTSVGVEIHVRHLAPTPVNGVVRIRAEIVAVEKQQISFTAKIFDELELVGEADHRRAVIDVDRFLKRVDAKVSRLSSTT